MIWFDKTPNTFMRLRSGKIWLYCDWQWIETVEKNIHRQLRFDIKLSGRFVIKSRVAFWHQSGSRQSAIAGSVVRATHPPATVFTRHRNILHTSTAEYERQTFSWEPFPVKWKPLGAGCLWNCSYLGVSANNQDQRDVKLCWAISGIEWKMKT